MKNFDQQTNYFLLPVLAIFLTVGVVASAPGLADIKKIPPPIFQIVQHKKSMVIRHNNTRKISGSIPAKISSRTLTNTGASPQSRNPGQMQSLNQQEWDMSGSYDLVKQGDESAQLGNWSQASILYHEALNLWPGNPDGLYGMGQCAAVIGDLPIAVSYYRTAIYAKMPDRNSTDSGDGFQTADVKRLMQFALLLNRAKQNSEAILIYNRAATFMDYDHGDFQGDQVVKVLLPELALEPLQSSQVQHTPERLQALADTAIAHEEMAFGSIKEALAHMQEAAKLYPDTAVTQYYLGEALSDSYNHTAQHPAADKVAMAAAYNRAIELGDDRTVAAAKERLKTIR